MTNIRSVPPDASAVRDRRTTNEGGADLARMEAETRRLKEADLLMAMNRKRDAEEVPCVRRGVLTDFSRGLALAVGVIGTAAAIVLLLS